MPNISSTDRAHSDEVEDIVSRSPSWLLKNSMWIITSIVAALIMSAFILKYPEVINVTVNVTNSFPSVNITAENNAQINSVRAFKSLTVNKGDTLLIFESEVRKVDIELIKGYIEIIENYNFNSDEIPNMKHPSQMELGDLKSRYTSLYLKWNTFLRNGGSKNNMSDVMLYDDVLKTSMIIDHDIKEWERRHVILSPISGNLSYRNMLKSGQFVSKEDHLFTIIPNEYEPVLFSEVPEDLIGKISLGDVVLIKLKEYPYKEFGKLRASVQEISSIPFNEKYLVRYKLDSGFVTTKHFKIPKLLNSVGQADIVLSNQTIMRLILNKY